MAFQSGKIEWMKHQPRRLWRRGDDVYEVTKGQVLLWVRVGIMRMGFLGNQMYFEVKAMRGNRIAILHSSFIKNVTIPIGSNVPSLVSVAYSNLAPDVPAGQVSPPLPPPPSASVKNGGSPIIRKTGLRSCSGGSSTPMNHPKFGAPAAATDSAGFLLCAHKERKLNCLLCKAGKTQDPKSGATVAAAVVQTRTLDITMATKSPAIATGPRPSTRSTSETVTSGPCEPAPRIPRIKEPPPLKVLPRL